MMTGWDDGVLLGLMIIYSGLRWIGYDAIIDV